MEFRRLGEGLGVKRAAMRTVEMRLAAHLGRMRRGPPFRHGARLVLLVALTRLRTALPLRLLARLFAVAHVTLWRRWRCCATPTASSMPCRGPIREASTTRPSGTVSTALCRETRPSLRIRPMRAGPERARSCFGPSAATSGSGATIPPRRRRSMPLCRNGAPDRASLRTAQVVAHHPPRLPDATAHLRRDVQGNRLHPQPEPRSKAGRSRIMKQACRTRSSVLSRRSGYPAVRNRPRLVESAC